MDEQSSSPPPNNIIVQSNPQIAAALAVNSPMQQGGPNPQQIHDQGQFVSQQQGPPGPQGPMVMAPGGGPIRIQTMQPPQMRAMPYPQQMRAPPPQGQHFPQMGIQQQQFPNGGPGQVGGQMQMGQRPPPMGMQTSGGQPGPSNHQMGMNQGPPPHMVQQGPQGPSFMQNPSPMPPPQMTHQPPPQPPPQQQPPPIQQQQPVMMPSVPSCGAIMDKTKLDELMQQISSTTVLEDSVKEVLVEYADDFVSSLIDKACKMIKNREQKKIESRDIEFLLKNVYNMPTVPRSATHIFGSQHHHSDVIDVSREKHIPTEAHKQRVALLKKQLRKV